MLAESPSVILESADTENSPASMVASTEVHEPRNEDRHEVASESAAPERDAYKSYLRQICKEKLLTLEEEIALAKRARSGDERARERLITANLRLVVKIAHDYEGLGVDVMDLISEGNIGLVQGIERYDPRFGAKISTYVSWWIKQRIKRALANQSKVVRLPVHMVDKLSRLRRTIAALQDQLSREPTDQEIATEMNVSPERIEAMRMAVIRPTSLDAAMGDDDGNTFSEVVADEKAELPSEELDAIAIVKFLRQQLKGLTPREAEILRLRFGLDGEPPKCLDEVGMPFGLTRERIRQIQNKALRKLRVALEKRGHSLSPAGF
jgi:RNA polymerase primary sigma factor